MQRFSSSGLFAARLSARLLVCLALVAGIASASAAGKFRFLAGMTYASGMTDLADKIEANHPARVDVLWPVGLNLRGEFEVAKNLSLGVNLGPAILVMGDVSISVIPLGVDAVYSFPSSGKARPFIRAGLQHPLVNGDFVDGGSAGVSGGVGCEFGKDAKVGYGFELGYGGAKVGVTTRRGGTIDAQPYGFTAALFARF